MTNDLTVDLLLSYHGSGISILETSLLAQLHELGISNNRGIVWYVKRQGKFDK